MNLILNQASEEKKNNKHEAFFYFLEENRSELFRFIFVQINVPILKMYSETDSQI